VPRADEPTIRTSSTVGLQRVRITVTGELDLVTGPQLLESVQRALQLPACRDLVIDIRDVSFADASAVGVLVRARRACEHVGGRLTVFGAHGVVAEILYLTGVAESLGMPMRPEYRRAVQLRPSR
jgi:anti-sigma B factor antagonist